MHAGGPEGPKSLLDVIEKGLSQFFKGVVLMLWKICLCFHPEIINGVDHRVFWPTQRKAEGHREIFRKYILT